MTAYLRLTAAAAALSLLLAAGCQSSATQDEALPDQSMQGSSQPAKEPAQPLTETVYQNYFFKAAIPSTWQVLSSDGPDIPAFITVQSKDHQATVTIRVSRSDLNVQDLCQLAAKGFVANGADIIQGPEVQFGTCIIKSNGAQRPTTLWLRAYEDHSVYAINFTGPQDKVNEILGRLQGNERMMQLLIMPL